MKKKKKPEIFTALSFHIIKHGVNHKDSEAFCLKLYHEPAVIFYHILWYC